ncbi:MAG: aldo/keto reductase [Kineosporiaceae bacterium]
MTAPAAVLPRRVLGGTGLEVSAVCLGGGPLAGMPETFGYDVPFEQAVATIRHALAGPITFLDTAAAYADGEGERRFGAALREAGGVPDGVVVATKIDRDLATGDFSGGQARRSLERSLTLLGLDSVPLCYLHDAEHVGFDVAMQPGGAVETLLAMRDEGLCDHVGVAVGPNDLTLRLVETGAFEVMLTHNRWTLVDRGAGAVLDAAVARGMGVVNAAVFGGGLLVRGTARLQRYAYAPAPEEVLQRVRRMEELCAGAGVPLGAAALQFSLRDPRITASVVGATTPAHVDDALRFATTPIPPQLWEELLPLAAPSQFWQP